MPVKSLTPASHPPPALIALAAFSASGEGVEGYPARCVTTKKVMRFAGIFSKTSWGTSSGAQAQIESFEPKAPDSTIVTSGFKVLTSPVTSLCVVNALFSSTESERASFSNTWKTPPEAGWGGSMSTLECDMFRLDRS